MKLEREGSKDVKERVESKQFVLNILLQLANTQQCMQVMIKVILCWQY